MRSTGNFSEEDRRLLQDSLRRLLERQWPAEAASAPVSPQAIRELWSAFAEQGLAALGAGEECGGLGEVLLVMEELGRSACPIPLVAAALANLAFAPTDAGTQQLLEQVHAGERSLAIAFAAFDGDPGAGEVVLRDGRLTGEAAFVECADSTDLLVAIDARTLALVSMSEPGVRIERADGYCEPSLARIRFEQAPAVELPLAGTTVEELHRLCRLMLSARAQGAAQRVFELALDHAKTRVQFGQPIGRFQAIQHKLANCQIALEGARRVLGNAATQCDRGTTDWPVFAAAACAFASPALRQVSLEAHHVLGAIGYAEEHEAPRHFRRVHADLVRHGGAQRANEELARHLIDDGHDLPDHDLGAEGNAFRSEVREWLAEFWNTERKVAYKRIPLAERHADPEFTAAIGRKGWHALAWPREHGGQARGAFEQLAFIEEIQRFGAPRAGRGEIQAHALMKYGTPEQQAKFLPKLRSGEILFCLGYSEPAAGSDLVALKTTAVRDGDEWVINGQKLWTTFGECADYMWLAARTDPQAKPAQAGISVFIVPMNAPGMTIRPSMALYGQPFCTEFLDEVRVPASALVGKENDGWRVITSALATERITMGGFVALVRANFEKLLHEVRTLERNGVPLRNDAGVRQRVGALAAEIEVARQLLIHCVTMLEQGQVPVSEAAISKTFTGELMERVGEAALDLLGAGATLAEGAPGAITDGSLEHMLRRSIMMVIGGGTAEIQRNLIAQRALGLPR